MISNAWARFAFLSLVTSAMVGGCVITTTDDDDDDLSFAGSFSDDDDDSDTGGKTSTGGAKGTGGTQDTGGLEETGGTEAAGASSGGMDNETGGTEGVAGSAGSGQTGTGGGTSDAQPAVCTGDPDSDECASCVYDACGAGSDTDDYCAACTGSCATEIDCVMDCLRAEETWDDWVACQDECTADGTWSSAESLDLGQCIEGDPEGQAGCDVECVPDLG